jgi:hypothetical protein
MTRASLKILSTAAFVILFAACHPEGCYGPKAFDYNTNGTTASNLVGTYQIDTPSVSVLQRKGFADRSGRLELKSDMTFVLSNIPCVWKFPLAEAYASARGKWRIAKHKAIWVIEIYDYDFSKMCGFASLTFPILRDNPPHGIELSINHDEGYYIRLER